ncbi:MAG TPA: phospholipase D-like domain-containing protein [Rhodanobacteraceae bacterium]|jgi:cardiolipin synthase|nr:phospholipase D-like domain-containing protein [Rhodanobacteraceae bacterium]
MPFSPAPATRPLAEQALSRAAGAPLSCGNAIELLIDARANFDAWLAAIRSARRSIFLANYIIRADTIGHAFLDALCERARAGVHVCVMRDWLGCLGQSGSRFWKPLLEAGGQVRVWNPFDPLSPFGWVNRDHRKLVSVDGRIAFISGICISSKWLGNAERKIPPWRDTGVALRGPAVAEIEASFAVTWNSTGDPLPEEAVTDPATIPEAGEVALRVIATHPSTAGMYRLDQMIAALARERLWLTDAYFVGVPPYVQALANAAEDGVDVRLLVPGTSDLPPVAAISRSGYRPLLSAGVRVFEWNGSMLHAKTAVADSRWARVGSTNLNLASWMGNCEIDVAVEDHAFARTLAGQYERDLQNATEIVLSRRRVRRDPQSPPREHVRRGKPGERGSAGRGAAGALRLAHTVGVALNNRRVLGRGETGPLLGGALVLLVLTAIAVLWPRAIAWPLAAIALWIAVGLAVRWLRVRRERHRAAHSR